MLVEKLGKDYEIGADEADVEEEDDEAAVKLKGEAEKENKPKPKTMDWGQLRKDRAKRSSMRAKNRGVWHKKYKKVMQKGIALGVDDLCKVMQKETALGVGDLPWVQPFQGIINLQRALSEAKIILRIPISCERRRVFAP